MNLDRDLIPPPFEMSEKRSLRIHFYVNHVHEVGTYFRFHNLAIGLTKLGHQVTVYAADQNFKSHRRLETRDNVAYFIEPENYLVRVFGNACDPITCFKRRFQKTPQCDVAHLFQPFPSAASAWFRSNAMVRFYDWDDLWSGGLMSGPISRMSDRWSRFVVGFLEARLLRWTNHVTGISQYLVDRARQHGAKNVTLVNSGSWPSEIVESRETLRSKLGLQNDGLYAGFMGRTTAELSWCFDALEDSLERHPQLRLAVCGPQLSELDGLATSVRNRIDYLGQLTSSQAKEFAACIDLGLLPMSESVFNQSRLPQKFGDHIGSGVPLLCSTVGECGRLIGLFPSAIAAGSTREDWVRTFRDTVDRICRREIPTADPEIFRQRLSWEGLSQILVDAYKTELSRSATDKT